MGEYGGKALQEFGFRVYDSGFVKGVFLMCRGYSGSGFMIQGL